MKPLKLRDIQDMLHTLLTLAASTPQTQGQRNTNLWSPGMYKSKYLKG